MKKLLSLISLALTVTVAADNFNETFNAQLTEGNLKGADSILTIWNSKSLLSAGRHSEGSRTLPPD